VVGVTTLLQLLASAREAGFAMDHGPDGALKLRGPKEAGQLARELLARKPEVLTVLHVWNDRAPMLDWRHARVLDYSRPCVICTRSTLLLDPWDGKPTHKTCAERVIRGEMTGRVAAA
jgi:hypothetical protein